MSSTLKSYDLNGYLSVLRFRATPTLMLEGRNDRSVYKRLLGELEAGVKRSRCVVVETAEEIVMPEKPGNRDRVEAVQLAANDAGCSLVSLIDREYVGFSVTQSVSDLQPGHCSQAANVFLTRGHSTENYFLEREAVTAFIQYRYPDVFDSEHALIIARQWNILLRRAAALSLACRDAGCLSKLGNAFPGSVWLDVLGDASLAEHEIVRAVAARGLSGDAANLLVDRLKQLLTICESSAADVCRWILHGHVGVELVWLGVGELFRALGVDGAVAEQIGHGDIREKRSYLSDWWARSHVTGPSPITPVPVWQALGFRPVDSWSDR